MKEEIKKIQFGEDDLLGMKTKDGQVWLGVRKVCLDIGLTDGQAQRQVDNIKKDLIFKSNYCKFAIVQNEGGREVTREVAKNRVNLLLGGAKSDLYKQLSRVYFKNLWTQLGNEFGVPTYKDLNPVNVNDAVNFIKAWDYVN